MIMFETYCTNNNPWHCVLCGQTEDYETSRTVIKVRGSASEFHICNHCLVEISRFVGDHLHGMFIVDKATALNARLQHERVIKELNEQFSKVSLDGIDYHEFINPYQEYLVRFAENHGLPLEVAKAHPMVKARYEVYKETGK